MDVLSLNGAWRGRELGPRPTIRKPFAARVPGCVHLDLRRAKLIPDPYHRDNERGLGWIGDADWAYSRTFTVPAKALARQRVLLRAHGLDTLATVFVNGKEVAKTDNQFRTYEWDVKKLLKAGRDANTIEIRFASANRYVNARDAKRHLFPNPCYVNEPHGRGYLRKSACNFGWDWGPVLVTAGIWRDIELVAFDTARLADVRVSQTHRADHRGPVTLRVEAEVEYAAPGRRPPLAVTVYVEDPEDTAVEGLVKTRFAWAAPVKDGRAAVDVEIDDPHRWWPAGMGGQPLYFVAAMLETPDADSDGPTRRAPTVLRLPVDGADVAAEAVAAGRVRDDDDGNLLDYWSRFVGLRTLGLVREKDQWGESFRFEANGVPFFAKGANWIPADTFPAGIAPELVDDLLQSAVDANMNMLRVWGGGLYEDDYFYERCDELGIAVWQDFLFACGAYPSFDPAWMKNVEAEFVDNVRRLRHHACLALWCGNNELEQFCMVRPGDEENSRAQAKYEWDDYAKLFDDLLPKVLARHDPGRGYWPSSEHTPGPGRKTDSRSAERGDAHFWAIWHGRKPFEFYRTSLHRFCSEFGFQSFQEPRGVAEYTAPGDRNVTSKVMEWHQRSGIGNSTIMHYMMEWFRMPVGFENTLWLSQLQQGMAMKYAIEHWRRNMPRCMGALYWQINDCWPVASWASLDWRGRWKALHYAAKKFFARRLVSGLEDAHKRTVEVFVTSDDLKPAPARVCWTLTDTDGQTLARGEKAVKTPANGSAKVLTVDAAKFADRPGVDRMLLWLELVEGREVVSANLVHFVKPKHLELRDPRLAATARDNGDGTFSVTLKAARPALWAWLALAGKDGCDARWSDNFFSVRPGRAVTVTCAPAKNLTLAQFKKALKVKSLYETSVE